MSNTQAFKPNLYYTSMLEVFKGQKGYSLWLFTGKTNSIKKVKYNLEYMMIKAS